MENKVIIACDSTMDLGPDITSQYRIRTMPVKIFLGNEEYYDSVDISPEYIYRHYETHNELPKTSGATAEEFKSFFSKNISGRNALVFFTISSEISSNYNSACLAAKNFDNVYVVNTENLSTGGGLLVLKACEMAEEGIAADIIAQKCSALTDKIDASFVIDNLEFLRKGGRCSYLPVFGVNPLKTKLAISINNGKMSVAKKYKGTFSNALKNYIDDKFYDKSIADTTRIFITHGGCNDKIIEDCVKQVEELEIFKEIIVTRAGCAVSSHCGRNTLGVMFLRGI